jgi:hypothetical protein
MLQRLVETVAEPGNVFAGLLNDCEVLGLRRIARELAEKRKGRVNAEKDTFRFRRAAFECVFITVEKNKAVRVGGGG